MMDSRTVREKLRKGELRTKKREGQRSAVWERFSEVVRKNGDSMGYVVCNHCDTLYVYNSHKTGTSNMVHHVCATEKGQPSQGHRFGPGRPSRRDTKVVSGEVKHKLLEDCVNMCCLDMRPFDIVSGKGFMQVAQTLIDIGARFGAADASSVLPPQQTLCDKAKQQAASEKEKLRAEIHQVIGQDGVAVTTDMWTDEFNKRAYTVLTCHFITDFWQLESRVLATVELDWHLEKTGDSIHEQINGVLMSYGIPADKTVFVSEQGPIVKTEGKERCQAYQWMPCSASILNTVLRQTFSEETAPDLVAVLDKCKSLMALLKKMGVVVSSAHTVSQECEVRMLEFILKKYNDIRTLLEERDQLHRLEGVCEEQLKHLVEFLALFKLAISELEGDELPTIHTVMLWFFKLKKHCQPKVGDPSYIAVLRTRAARLLQEKMAITPTHKVATFLCPKFKSLKMLTVEDRQEVLRLVRERLFGDINLSMDPEEGSYGGCLSSETDARECKLAKRQKVDFTEWEDLSPDLMDEVDMYCSTNFQLEENWDLLSFWDNHGRSFPQLQHLAKRILCIPATSSASERSFSSAGHIIDARRSRLNPGTVDAILFLHSAKKSLCLT